MTQTNTLIKWPGGKSREIKYIEELVPSHKRYIEPFFGGGAMYFYLRPREAAVNDISSDLINFYSLVKSQNNKFRTNLNNYSLLTKKLISACEDNYEAILNVYRGVQHEGTVNEQIDSLINSVLAKIEEESCSSIILNFNEFKSHIKTSVVDKMKRTVKNERVQPYNRTDLKENLITGFMSGLYMYFRGVYNDILLNRKCNLDLEYRIANFYFIREYCYGSMFRYNNKGEFNIPYGGMSYNRKNFGAKVDNIFSSDMKDLFSGTDVYCQDFEDFLKTVEPNENDFMFLDPPYDTDFSDYEGKDFTKADQQRLAEVLRCTKAKFILIIKNTDFIHSLYDKYFKIFSFDKTYSYNVRSRNERNTKHLVVTNV